MPDGDSTTSGQEPNTTTTTAPAAGEESPGSRSIDAFPEDAQDYIRRLRQENAARRNELKTASDRLKEIEDRSKTDEQRRQEAADQAASRASSAESKLLRYEVAAEKNLPLKYAGRLQGSTKEELAADADQLMQDFGLAGDGEPSGAGRPGFDGGVRRPVQRPKSMNGLIRQASGR